MNNSAGKGDKYRKVDKQKYDDNYTRIFGVRRPIWITQEGWDNLSDEQRRKLLTGDMPTEWS